jgi:copper(I)-binding protein
MGTLTPSTAKGKTQCEANAWRNRDDSYDPMASGAYNHTNDRLGATEVDEWVSWMYFINSLILGGAGALRIRNETGGALAAGPVRISSYSYTHDRWLVTLADADANAPAHAVLLAALNDTTNGTAYLSGDLTYDTSTASAVGSRCYLAADGTITFTAPTGADQVVQELGEVKVKHATGTIACFVRPPIKVGTSWLQDLAVATAKIAASAVTYAKIQNVSAQGKVLGRSTAAAGVVEEVACDESTITLPAGGTLQLKTGGTTYAKLQNVSAQGKVLGRSTAAAGVVEEVACDESTITLPAGGTVQMKDGGTTAAKLATAVQDMVPYLTVSAAAESSDNVDVTLQVKDAAGNNLAEEHLIEFWLADTATGWELGTAPSGGVSVTTGVAADVATAGKRIRLVTDTNGTAVIRATEAGTKTAYARARLGSKVVTATCTWAA